MPWGVYTSPPIGVEFVGDKLQFNVLWCPTNQNPSNSAGNLKKVLIRETPQKLTRNAWHTVKIEAKNQNDNSGYYKAWIDGTQVANYSGPVGFGYKVYWECGPYRATDSTPIRGQAAQHQDGHVDGDSNSDLRLRHHAHHHANLVGELPSNCLRSTACDGRC